MVTCLTLGKSGTLLNADSTFSSFNINWSKSFESEIFGGMSQKCPITILSMYT